MKNILVCNQKGGVGKSLIADELAFSFERSGIPVSFFDLDSPSVEDAAIANVMSEKLHRCLALLPVDERTLLEKIYFSGQSEYEVAKTLGIPRMTVHNRKARALCKLKKMMTQ